MPPKIKRILGIVAIIVLVISIILRPDPKPQNVILISVDTLRQDSMGIYGYEKNTTPNIDAWAKKSIVFENAYSVLPLTYPSFVTLLTGNSPFTTGILNNRQFYGELIPGGKALSPSINTLPKILKTNGYVTAAFLSNPNASITTEIHPEDDLSSLEGGFDKYKINLKEPYEKFISQGIDWMRENKNNKFFLWIHLIDPHTPYDRNADSQCEFGSEFCREIISKGQLVLEQERKNLSECRADPIPQDKTQLYKSLYDAEIRYTDILVGKILENIKNEKLDKNTIIVFYSDHGEGFDHNYNFAHGQVLYESSVKIPFIISLPNKKTGSTIKSHISNMDFLPTILEILNINTSQKFDGSSYAGALKNPGIEKERKYIYFTNYLANKFAVFDGKYKYILSSSDSCNYNNQMNELYNVIEDPDETSNLIEKERKIAGNLRSTLLEYLKNKKPEDIKNKTKTENNKEVNEKLKNLGY